MKPHPLVYLSLVISLCAVGYAAWLHLNAERLAMNALRQRETEIVNEFAPKLEQVYRDMFPERKSVPKKPESFADLFWPYFLMSESVDIRDETTNSVTQPE